MISTPTRVSELPDRIFVAGHRGMVGSAICRRLAQERCEVLTASRSEVDLRDPHQTHDFFRRNRPDAVVFAAARVGGIHANNSLPVEFLQDNVQMTVAAIEASFNTDVKRFLMLGSTCIYPRECPQPITESSLLTGPLESTNEAYALAKITGVKLCEFYRRQKGVLYHSAMPTNLYGPGDNYHESNSHVLPALLHRFHQAKNDGLPSVTIWGSGRAQREFLHCDDLADSIVHLLKLADPPDWVNVGTGKSISIADLATLIAETTGYDGEIKTDPSRPDGTPIKCSDVSLLNELGWRHTIDLKSGLQSTYESFLSELQLGKLRSV
ncbi:MAG: GDP-L-fucose synthase [Planctomycetota bacterium]